MEMEIREELAAALERLTDASGQLEQAAERLAQREMELTASAGQIERVVATVDPSSRERELEEKLAAAEQKIAVLEARAAASVAPETSGTRKTVPTATASLLAKHAMSADSIQAGALDAALVHLSLEQRIAVKADLMRAGLIG